MPMQDKTPCCIGLLAHVDAGKTTLSEALMYLSGARRVLGRVDHADALLDHHRLERQRGITIFSKQARLQLQGREVILVDTPGHVDFCAETERTLPVLDLAVLVISATDGVQPHTRTLWQLLERYGVPTVVFVNKTDLPGIGRRAMLEQLRQRLSPACAEPGDEESVALCDERLLEQYLHTGSLPREALALLVSQRRLFPCFFGSALHLQGVQELLDGLVALCPRRQYPAAFGARVYKVSRDARGERLTWLKVTGGTLRVRTELTYTDARGGQVREKPVGLRLYSGEKFTATEQVEAGGLCAAVGLSATWAGQTLGWEQPLGTPVLEPVMRYRLVLPQGTDAQAVLPRLRQLEEEDPQLRLMWDPGLGEIYVQLMGRVQLEVLESLLRERFDLAARLDEGRIYYKETIASTVEGVGHFEPLRHYAEVHLLLEPLPPGSGVVVDNRCSADVLEPNYQRLILSHIEEKCHLGVLTGSPVTDIKITLLSGRAHVKHTEGGDFRQATYRAVRQGLMQAESRLLEPWYDFELQLPTGVIGRGITDIRAMGGRFDAPEQQGEMSVLRGSLPASELGDYAQQVAAYSRGLGQLHTSLRGYEPCHNAQAVIDQLGYDPVADVENTPDSVFCDHGSGFIVPWDRVKDYMHLSAAEKPRLQVDRLRPDERALEEILSRELCDRRPRLHRPGPTAPAAEQYAIRAPRQQYLIVDGYNVLFAVDALAKLAREDLDSARRTLLDRLCDYAAYSKKRTVVVFDGYKRRGSLGEKTAFGPLSVVYTAEGETADSYIEQLAVQVGPSYQVQVASSDSLVQLGSLRSGVLRLSARELWQELEQTRQEMRAHYQK